MRGIGSVTRDGEWMWLRDVLDSYNRGLLSAEGVIILLPQTRFENHQIWEHQYIVGVGNMLRDILKLGLDQSGLDYDPNHPRAGISRHFSKNISAQFRTNDPDGDFKYAIDLAPSSKRVMGEVITYPYLSVRLHDRNTMNVTDTESRLIPGHEIKAIFEPKYNPEAEHTISHLVTELKKLHRSMTYILKTEAETAARKAEETDEGR